MISRVLKYIFALSVLVALLGSVTICMAEIKPAMRQIPRQGPLTEREMSWAKTAWSYFQNNVNPVTGLAGAQPNYSPFTMWDLSAHMAAILSANELGLIDDKEFDSRMRKIISWLNVMELFRGDLPNQFYSADNGAWWIGPISQVRSAGQR